MRLGFPLLIKKRGQRRTASDRVGRWGELFFCLFFFLTGALVLWWHVARVMVPDWKSSADLTGLRAASCRIVDTRVAERQTVKGYDYRAELRIVPMLEVGEAAAQWTHDGAGEFSPNRDDAQRTLEQFEIGNSYPCWVDPADPSRISLGRDYRWWPWLVVLIPISLLIYGGVGSVRTLRQWNASSEWQAISQQMSTFDIRAVEQATRPQLDAVPRVDRVVDSPGVRLAYRLPIDGSPNWRLAAMGVVCLCWNALVLVFAQQLVVQFLYGTPNWIIAALVLPFAFGGIWLIVLWGREAWNVVGVGTTNLEVSSHPLYPGSECQLFLMQSGQMNVRSLAVDFVCEERAVYQEGTDTREWVETVFRESVFRERNFQIEHGAPFESEFSLRVPEGAMHSFHSNHNEVRWSLEVSGVPRRWPEFQRRFPIYVYPAQVAVEEQDSPLDGSLKQQEVPT